MRSVYRFAVIAALCASAGGVAFAGNYHQGEYLKCSDCHVMHGGTTHDYDNPPGAEIGYNTWAGNDVLLKGTGDEACLVCHADQTFAPDVIGLVSSAQTVSRSAGFFEYEKTTVSYKGHNLGTSITDIPNGDGGGAVGGLLSGGADDELNCVDCHMHHGENSYRNLTVSGTAVPITVTLSSTPGVLEHVRINATPNFTNTTLETAYYDRDQTNYQLMASGEDAYAQLCALCHGIGIHTGNAKVGSFYQKHPTNAPLAAGGSGKHTTLGALSPYITQSVKHVRGMENASDTVVRVSCMSCHYAHGSDQPFGLVRASKDLCSSCHP